MTSTTQERPGPANAENVAAVGGRVYTDPVSDERFPSVTTIIGATSAKHGIADWSAKLAAEFAIDNVPVWQGVLQAAGRDAAVDLIRKASERYRDAAGARGSFVHDVIESLALDKPAPVIEGEVEAALLDQFLRWVSDYDVEFHAAELTVANRTLGYAGTLDAIVTLGRCSGRRYLIDAKTGKSLWPAEVAPQLVAYRRAEEVWLPMGGKDDMPEVDGAAALHLHADDYDFVELKADDLAWEDFCNRVRAYQSARQLSGKRSVVGKIRREGDPRYVEDFVSLSICRSALEKLGLTTLEQLAEFTVADLRRLDGVGPKSVTAIGRALSACGLATTDKGWLLENGAA